MFSSVFTNLFWDGEVPTVTPDAEGDRYKITDAQADHNYLQEKIVDSLLSISASPSTRGQILFGGVISDGGSGTINITECVFLGRDSSGNKRIGRIPALTGVAIPSGWNDGRQIWVVGKYDFKLGTESRVHNFTQTNYHYQLKDTYMGDSNGYVSTGTDDLFVSSPPSSYDAVLGSFTMTGTTFADLSSNSGNRAVEFSCERFDGAHKSTDGTFANNSDSLIPTEKAINTYFSSGWIPSRETWTYASADSPTFQFTVPGDVTGKYSKDMKLRFQQSQALTAYWSFDSSSSPDVGAFTMTNIGTPTYTTGKFGNALTLNGSSGLSIADSALLRPTGDFTIGAWIKTGTSSETTIFSSFESNSSCFGGFVLRIVNNCANVLIGNNTGGTTYELNLFNLSGNTTVNDNNWHYIVAAIRNNYIQIYVDGRLDGARYIPAPVYSSPYRIRIGLRCDDGSSNSYYFNGQIDDLFLINGYALDEETIRQKYLTGTAQGAGDITITKHGIISDHPSYSSVSGLTTITMYCGTDFALANATISNPYYSLVAQPYGFDRNPDKWSVIRENRVSYRITSPGTGILYSAIGSINLTMPVGVWIPIHKGKVTGYHNNGGFDVVLCLSRSSSTETDVKLKAQVSGYTYASMNCCNFGPVFFVRTKTPFYLLGRSSGDITYFYLSGEDFPTVIKFQYANI